MFAASIWASISRLVNFVFCDFAGTAPQDIVAKGNLAVRRSVIIDKQP
jgi:hypothetical protein